MLLWASKFATAKIEYSFEMGKYNKHFLEGNINFAGDVAMDSVIQQMRFKSIL